MLIYFVALISFDLRSLHYKVTPRFHRSVEGGVGGVKATGNYAPVFKASLEAKVPRILE